MHLRAADSTSSVEAFIAQRLVRVICDKCKDSSQLSAATYQQLTGLGMKIESRKLKIFRGKGCKTCNNTGYIGRTGIYEILVVNEEIKKLILQKVSSDVIKEKALKMGMKTLRQDGWNKVMLGITTPEEVIRVTQLEE